MATRKKQPYGQPYVYRVLFGPGEREEMYVEAEDLDAAIEQVLASKQFRTSHSLSLHIKRFPLSWLAAGCLEKDGLMSSSYGEGSAPLAWRIGAVVFAVVVGTLAIWGAVFLVSLLKSII